MDINPRLCQQHTKCEVIHAFNIHYSDITWASWQLKSSAIRWLVHQLVRSKVKGNIGAPHYWIFVKEIHRSDVVSPHKRPVMPTGFPCPSATQWSYGFSTHLINCTFKSHSHFKHSQIYKLKKIWKSLSESQTKFHRKRQTNLPLCCWYPSVGSKATFSHHLGKPLLHAWLTCILWHSHYLNQHSKPTLW